MKFKKNHRTVLLTTVACTMLFGVVACIKDETKKEVLGYAPVYASTSALSIIKNDSIRPFVNAGKIYHYQNYTFQLENGTGIHIINSMDASNPQKIGFIQVSGCSEISIKNNILYTDNNRDLVGIKIADINNVQVVSRLEKVFPGVNQEYPPVAGVSFECVDATKGTVISWTEKLLINPKCKR